MTSLPIKTLLASTLLHFFILHSFIFTFSDQSVSIKPRFVFLGSILQIEDLQGHPSKGNQKAINFGSIDISSESNLTKQFVNDAKASSKPSFSETKLSKEKVFFKSTFYENDGKENKKGSGDKKILGIDLRVPPRLPLRLFQK